MARPFSGPIRIYRTFGHPRQSDVEFVHMFVRAQWKLARTDRESDFWRGVFFGFLYDPAPDPLDRLTPYVRRRAASFRLADVIHNVRNHFLEIANVKDALAVDDHFMAYVDPESVEKREGSDLREQVADALRRGASPNKIESSLLNTPPCLHSKHHSELLRDDDGNLMRGPRRKADRRAATWGTYIVAWLVGSDTLAANLWNRLVLPDRYKWAGGASASAESAAKKYADAKGKLVRDLSNWCSRRVVNVAAEHNTYRPLEPDIATDVARLIELYAQLEGGEVDLSDYDTRIAHAGRSLFPFLEA